MTWACAWWALKWSRSKRPTSCARKISRPHRHDLCDVRSQEAKSALPIPTIIAIAKEKNIPVFVDAAAEEPHEPQSVYMQQGASFVGYSGGKCLRAPQSSGMLLGKADLIKAAWFQASPHHNYGRALKCSKEETMGLLAAVRQWYKRDHDGEQRMWRGWMQSVEARLKPIKGLSFEYLEPQGLSNRATRLRIKWDASEVGITGNELEKRLNDGTPRIMVELRRGPPARHDGQPASP